MKGMVVAVERTVVHVSSVVNSLIAMSGCQIIAAPGSTHPNLTDDLESTGQPLFFFLNTLM